MVFSPANIIAIIPNTKQPDSRIREGGAYILVKTPPQNLLQLKVVMNFKKLWKSYFSFELLQPN
jgi:hypothetical protein